MCVPSAGSAIGIPKIRNNCENAARRQRQVAARLGTTSRMNGLRWKTADGKSRTNCTRQQSSDSAAKCVASLPGRHHSEKYCDPTPGKPIYATEFSDFQVYSEYIAPVELFAGSYYSKSTVLQSPSKKKNQFSFSVSAHRHSPHRWKCAIWQGKCVNFALLLESNQYPVLISPNPSIFMYMLGANVCACIRVPVSVVPRVRVSCLFVPV